MKALLQAGHSGRVPATPEKRFLISDRATLLFVFQGKDILLIRKKRGLGAGKINGPGGRIEDGETPLEAAVREVEEELCITPHSPELRGMLRFQFLDGYSIQCHVYSASAFDGTPTETDEAIPLWTPCAAIPYDEMWSDDRHWFPVMLNGESFDGRFTFDGDRMVDHVLDTPAPHLASDPDATP